MAPCCDGTPCSITLPGSLSGGNLANTAFENYIYNNVREGLWLGSADAADLEPKANKMSHNWVINNGSRRHHRTGLQWRDRQHVRP